MTPLSPELWLVMGEAGTAGVPNGLSGYLHVSPDSGEGWDAPWWGPRVPRVGAATVHDALGRMWMHGGSTFDGASFVALRETWRLETAPADALSRVDKASTPPLARSFASAAIDLAKGRVVVWGGAKALNGISDPAKFALQEPEMVVEACDVTVCSWAPADPATLPALPIRVAAATAHDPSSGRTWLFGGGAEGGAHPGDLWEIDLAVKSSKILWKPEKSPGPLLLAGAAIVPVPPIADPSGAPEQLLVVGRAPATGLDVWSFALATGVFTPLTTDATFAPIFLAAVWDAPHEALLLLGGTAQAPASIGSLPLAPGSAYVPLDIGLGGGTFGAIFAPAGGGMLRIIGGFDAVGRPIGEALRFGQHCP